ncbi:unnamed protein product, partial [Ixodes hexagonus]
MIEIVLCIVLAAPASAREAASEHWTSGWVPGSFATTLCGGIVAVLFFVVVREKFKFSKIGSLDPHVKKKKKKNPDGRFIKILYGTQTGNAKILSEKLLAELEVLGHDVELVNLKHIEPEECLLGQVKSKGLCIFIVSTYVDGGPPDEAVWFYDWLKDTYADFRVHKYFLQGLDYAIYGLGDSAFDDNFNKVARDVDFWLSKLQARRVVPLCLNDESVDEGKYGTGKFGVWKDQVLAHLSAGAKDGMQSDAPEVGKPAAYETSSDEEGVGDLIDLEDLGAMRAASKAKAKAESALGQPKDMLTPPVRQSLTKQGYKLIGSHSGVKLCRWTKAMLRGRGGCYKHTFYGIESHRCMEATPSLACANKCVFCWRHHTNPVGTEWKWNMDPPEMILDAALEHHYKMIKEFRG